MISIERIAWAFLGLCIVLLLGSKLGGFAMLLQHFPRILLGAGVFVGVVVIIAAFMPDKKKSTLSQEFNNEHYALETWDEELKSRTTSKKL